MGNLIAMRRALPQQDGAPINDEKVNMTEISAPSRHLLAHLVCPVTKGPLHYDKQAQLLISPQIKKAFPIRSGVPILLVEEAVTWDPEAKR